MWRLRVLWNWNGQRRIGQWKGRASTRARKFVGSIARSRRTVKMWLRERHESPLALMVFVIAELLAAVPASAGRPVLQIEVFLQRTARRKTPVAHVAAEGTLRGRHGYCLRRQSPALALAR